MRRHHLGLFIAATLVATTGLTTSAQARCEVDAVFSAAETIAGLAGDLSTVANDVYGYHSVSRRAHDVASEANLLADVAYHAHDCSELRRDYRYLVEAFDELRDVYFEAYDFGANQRVRNAYRELEDCMIIIEEHFEGRSDTPPDEEDRIVSRAYRFNGCIGDTYRGCAEQLVVPLPGRVLVESFSFYAHDDIGIRSSALVDVWIDDVRVIRRRNVDREGSTIRVAPGIYGSNIVIVPVNDDAFIGDLVVSYR